MKLFKTKEVKDLEKKIDELQSTLIIHFNENITSYQVKTEKLMNVSQRQTVEQLEPRLAKIEAELKEIKEKLWEVL